MTDYSKYALIDIHLHIDGSLTADDVMVMSRMSGKELPGDARQIAEKMSCPLTCNDLREYLVCFDLPLSVMQTAETIAYGVKSLLCRLASERILYVEARFAPQQHTREGLTQQQVVEAAMHGLEQGLKLCNGTLRANLVLSCMRGSGNEAANEETVRVASEYLGRGVCGVDLAGNEAAFPTENFRTLFVKARVLRLPITIHAGEAAGAESVVAAVEMGATVLGHGVRMHDNEPVMALLRERDVCLTMCPTSNLQTKALKGVDSYDKYPVAAFMEHGVPVTINTDNTAVSCTTLADEYRHLFEAGVLNEEMARQTVLDAITHCFASDDEKALLLALAKERMQ